MKRSGRAPLLALLLGALALFVVLSFVFSSDSLAVDPLGDGDGPGSTRRDAALAADSALYDLASFDSRSTTSVRAPAGRRTDVVEREEEASDDDRDEDERSAPTLDALQDFRAYLEEARKEFRQEQAADDLRRIENRRAALDDRLSMIEEALDLTRDQSDRLRTLLLSQLDREAEYVRLRKSSADDQILQELRVSDRARFFTELGGVLRPSQVERYLDLEN